MALDGAAAAGVVAVVPGVAGFAVAAVAVVAVPPTPVARATITVVMPSRRDRTRPAVIGHILRFEAIAGWHAHGFRWT
ncbi:hypothetical protein SANTM175S_00223 [Streptomyces antimycoticus]